jgi:hypothetical protein
MSVRSRYSWVFLLAAFVLQCSTLAAQGPLYTAGQDFTPTSRFVATSVFHWFTRDEGQNEGAWVPEEGRQNWTGEPDFWQRQIKDIMDANIDLIYVHLWAGMETQRINLFKALAQLRAQGYAVPKVVPFLDPPLTWVSGPIDLATTAGKDEFVAQYVRFFNQYFGQNADAWAESHLAHIDGKVVLDTWGLGSSTILNKDSLSRSDVESRLSAALGDAYPSFRNGVYMIGSATAVAWFDETAYQFAGTSYYIRTVAFNNHKTAVLRPGYWDELIRDPGRFVPRDGGTHFADEWSCLNSIKAGAQVDCSAFPYLQESNAPPIYHAIIESSNEYDEGTGIFAADPGPPVVPPSGHTDVWSSTNKPREYIDAAAAGATQFNDTPRYAASLLWHDLPTFMYAGETRIATVIVRNEGENEWNAASGYKLGQGPSDPVLFGPGRYLIDDAQDGIPKYSNIFRGRPKTFLVALTAPRTTGLYNTHWQMLRESVRWFGPVLTNTIRVAFPGDFDFDNDVDQKDFGHLQVCFSQFALPAPAGCEDTDLDRDGDVDRDDFVVFHSCAGGADRPPGC